MKIEVFNKFILALWVAALWAVTGMAQEQEEQLPNIEQLPIINPYPDIPFFADEYSALKLFKTEDTDAQSGVALFMGKKYANAVPFLQRAAKQGDGLSMSLLGFMYGSGLGVEKNGQIAHNMLEKGIQAKCPLAHCYNAYFYINDQKIKEALAEYEKAISMDGNCALAYYMLSRLYWYAKKYDLSVSYLEQVNESGVPVPNVLGRLYAEGKVVSPNYDKAFNYLTVDGWRYTPSEQMLLAQLYYYGRGAGTENFIKKMQKSSKYTKHYFKDGESGRASITDALIILERLVADGYTPATELYNKVKAEHEERHAQANELTPVLFSDAARRYTQSYRLPNKPAIESAGFGEIVVTARVSSSGRVLSASLKSRVLQRLDEDALNLVRGMPALKPGTRGGFPVDMVVDIGIRFFPSYSLKIKKCLLAQ